MILIEGLFQVPGAASARDPARGSTEGGRLATFAQTLKRPFRPCGATRARVTRDADIADDLVQDTLVRALRSEHLFHGGEVRSWLYTILTNLNRNRLRSLSRRPPMSSIEDNDAPDLAGPEAGGRDIERALATLVEDQRNALLLVVLEGPQLPRSRGSARRTDWNRDVASGACTRAIKTYLDGERPALRRVK